jgi:hypothetical protein
LLKAHAPGARRCRPQLESGILLAVVASVLLNASLNGVGGAERARSEASATAAAAEHV